MPSFHAFGRSVRGSAPLLASLLLAFGVPTGCGGQAFSGGHDDAGSPGPCEGASCALDAAPVDSGGTCQCTGPAPSAPNYQCTDGTTGGPVCEPQLDGACGWVIRTCTPVCPGLGCDPACPNGVLRDKNGCETCTCAPVPDSGTIGPACVTDTDCGTGGLCGYPTANACSATGTCFPAPGVVCDLYSPGCACDGTTIGIACTGLPTGYASKPLLHSGVCMNGGASDGGTDGGACCPANWDLFSCKYPDGGAGMDCADPAAACAISTICGQGCGQVVTGRCGA
jgi:hypothetical protein